MRKSSRQAGRIVLAAGLMLSTLMTASGHADAAEVSLPAMIPATQISIPAELLGRPNCVLWIGPYGLASGGRRANGTWYGTMVWNSRIVCDGNMVYLWTKADLVKLPATTFTEGWPGRCGADRISATPTAGCRDVQMGGGSHYCDPCNGTYNTRGTYVLRFTGIAPGYTFEDSACTPQYGGRVTCTTMHPQNYVLN